MFLLSIGGGAVALFLAVALLAKKERHLAENLLSITLLLQAFDLFLRGYIEGQGYRSFPFLIGLDRSLPLLYGPILYLLAASAAGQIRRLTPIHLLHLIPFIFHLLLMAPFYLKNQATRIFLQERYIPGVAMLEPSPVFLFGLKALVLLCYLIAAFAAMARYERLLREFYSDIERHALSWLRLLFLVPVAQCLILCGSLLFHLLYLPWFVRINVPGGYYALHLLFAALAGMQLFRSPGRWRSTVDIERLLEPEPVEGTEAKEKYQKTRLEQGLAEEYRERLMHHMEETRPYTDPLLTLPQLAKQVGIPAHHLSQVLNGLLGMNFYAFVNGYRIGYAKELLGKADGPANVLEVAFAAGFNSKSAFNTYFRKETGMTPTEFRRQTIGRTEGGGGEKKKAQ